MGPAPAGPKRGRGRGRRERAADAHLIGSSRWIEGTEVDHDSGGGGGGGGMRGGGEERGRQECGTVGGGGVLGAEKGRGRVWGAAASTRDGRVWGGLAPAHDGADRGRRRTDVEGPPGRGAVEGLGSGGADAGFLARCEGEGDAFFFFLLLLDRRMRVLPAE
jgi:hypothetical protein